MTFGWFLLRPADNFLFFEQTELGTFYVIGYVYIGLYSQYFPLKQLFRLKFISTSGTTHSTHTHSKERIKSVNRLKCITNIHFIKLLSEWKTNIWTRKMFKWKFRLENALFQVFYFINMKETSLFKYWIAVIVITIPTKIIILPHI